jgi:hypothetical protein
MRDMGLGMKAAEVQHQTTLNDADTLRSELATATVIYHIGFPSSLHSINILIS